MDLTTLCDRTKLRLAAKINAEYGNARTLPSALLAQQKGGVGPQRPGQPAGAMVGKGGAKLIEGESQPGLMGVWRRAGGRDACDGLIVQVELQGAGVRERHRRHKMV